MEKDGFYRGNFQGVQTSLDALLDILGLVCTVLSTVDFSVDCKSRGGTQFTETLFRGAFGEVWIITGRV